MTNLTVGARVRLERSLALGTKDEVPSGTIGVVASHQSGPNVRLISIDFPEPYGCWGVGEEDLTQLD